MASRDEIALVAIDFLESWINVSIGDDLIYSGSEWLEDEGIDSDEAYPVYSEVAETYLAGIQEYLQGAREYHKHRIEEN